ncbi:MAG: hypothetical protein AB1442_02300 [Nitrospirota bacterium]
MVAFADNDAITFSELEDHYATAVRVTPNISMEEVLNTMVNRLLLTREAKRLRLEAKNEDELLKEYIDLKIRAFIRIDDKDITQFYEEHVANFEGKELDAVRDDIESYLAEKELNERLKEHVAELRGRACVKIQSTPPIPPLSRGD